MLLVQILTVISDLPTFSLLELGSNFYDTTTVSCIMSQPYFNCRACTHSRLQERKSDRLLMTFYYWDRNVLFLYHAWHLHIISLSSRLYDRVFMITLGRGNGISASACYILGIIAPFSALWFSVS